MNQDKKLVAHRQDHQREVKYIADRYKIPFEKVEEAMLLAGKNGKYGRSRTKIYENLREMGFKVGGKKVPDKVI